MTWGLKRECNISAEYWQSVLIKPIFITHCKEPLERKRWKLKGLSRGYQGSENVMGSKLWVASHPQQKESSGVGNILQVAKKKVHCMTMIIVFWNVRLIKIHKVVGHNRGWDPKTCNPLCVSNDAASHRVWCGCRHFPYQKFLPLFSIDFPHQVNAYFVS